MKITKKLEPFPVLFEQAEGIRRANITIRTKQPDWFSANRRRYTWRGNQKVKNWCCRTTKLKQKLLHRRLKLYQPARNQRRIRHFSKPSSELTVADARRGEATSL